MARTLAAWRAVRPRDGAASLPGGRHGELRPLGRALRPALHDGFLPRVETHAFLTVGVHVSEQAVLPAAEAVPGHGHGNRHIDTHHADLDAAPEFARNVAIAGVAGHAIGERMRIHELHCGREVRHAHAGEYRAKDLLAVDAHLRGHMVEQRRSEPEALLVTGDGEGRTAQRVAPAIHDQRGAACDAIVYVAADALDGRLADDRAHLGIALHPVADTQPPRALGEPRYQHLGSVADEHRYRDRHAALSRRAVSRADQRVRRLLEVGV